VARLSGTVRIPHQDKGKEKEKGPSSKRNVARKTYNRTGSSKKKKRGFVYHYASKKGKAMGYTCVESGKKKEVS